MQKTAYKISVLFLCGLLIYNSLGYFMVLSVMRVAVRHQNWAKLSAIPENQLTTFIFNKNEQNSRLKIENSHEILVDGKLFDVVRITDEGKQLKYSCVYDPEEETLISKTRLFNSNAQQMPVQSTARNIIDKIIKTGVCSETANLISESLTSFDSDYPSTNYSGPVIQISSPPPQQVI
jgi:hypothetical protein